MMDEEPAPKRIRLNDTDLEKLSKEDLMLKWRKQEAYITALENKTDLSNHNAAKLSEMEDRLHQQQNEFAQKERKDRLLVMRLATKEQELQELANQLTEMTKGQAPGSSQLRSALLDPALNLIFQRMRKELEDKSKLLQQAQDDMSAWKFTADSQMGKRLMSRCRTLIQENQELGKQVSAGRTARLETELALQKKYSEELKGSQDELNDFVIELDEEVVGMQSTICALQQQLKDAKQAIANIKAQASKPMEASPATPPPIAAEAATNIAEQDQTQRTSEASSKIETRTDDMETDWKDKESGGAQIFTEPTRQSAEVPESTSWTTYERAGEVAAEKSPSTPTEEETFRIPEAPRTVEMGPTSPAIPEEASSAPAPQEETMKARTSASLKEQPMEEESDWGKKEEQEEERTFQVPPQPEQQVNIRTTDGTPPPEIVTTSPEEVERTQDEKMETPAEPDEPAAAVATVEETPMEAEPVPEPRAAQESQESQVKEEEEVKEEKEEKEQHNQAAKSDDTEAKEGNQIEVSSAQGVEDSNNAATPVGTTNGNTRTEEETPDQGTETGSTNHNTKNGEFSPAHPVSPPQSSDNNNQGAINSNCNVTNSPSSNNVEEDGPSQSTEDGTETNSSETLQNSESVATEATAADVTDRTNSPVKQILVKSSDGEGLIGGGESEGSEKQQNVSDVPPLKENGPETVSN